MRHPPVLSLPRLVTAGCLLISVVLPACADEAAAADSVVDGSELAAPAVPVGDAGDAVPSPAAPADLARDPALPPALDALLEVAFDAASAMPLDPHVKTRSLLQGELVTAALVLDQPERAMRFAEGIANWRRGAAYADYAYHCAQRDPGLDVQPWLERAVQVAVEGEGHQEGQEWRIDRVRGKVALTHLLLGRQEQAEAPLAGLGEADAAELAVLRARDLTPADAETHLASVDALAGAASFEALRFALQTCAELQRRFYADAGLRTRLEDKITGSWTKLPLTVRVALLVDLAEAALDHEDRPHALQLIDDARAIVGSFQWTPADHIALLARLAGLRHRAGDAERARAEVQVTLAMYDSARERIVDIERADALWPVAEAWLDLGDVEAARAVYLRALDECVVNPNSRPRAEDLVAITGSLVRKRCDPGDAVLARMRQVRAGLGDPW